VSSTRQPSIRDANLAGVLTLVHLEGPLSRASLTRRTGLNRSTIGGLVSALAEAGLVVEGEPRPSQRVGRPSPVVAADPRVVALAANPEVDALTIAVFGLGRRILARVRQEYDAPPSAEQAATIIATQLAAWRRGPLAGVRVAGIGLAVPGLVRASDGLVRTAPHLGWTDADLSRLVTSATGLPAAVGNDANLGVLAEHRFGAARGVNDVVYLNGGDGGIGGGIIAGGVLVGGADGYAGEFGHSRVTARSTLEEEVSRARLLRAIGTRALDEAALTAAVGGAQKGDAVWLEARRQRGILTRALADIVGTLSPSVVVLGGFLTDLVPENLDEFTVAVLAQTRPAAPRAVAIRRAGLVENRLLFGAAEVVFDEQVLAPENLERWCADGVGEPT
jgi:predicted NBD/HSP70 family sugar kinase